MSEYPTIRVLPGQDKRLRTGSPWIFANELRLDDEAKSLKVGSIVRIMSDNAKILGVAHFNAHTLIAGRVLTRNKDATIDAAFFKTRLERALDLRGRAFSEPYYRWVHGEADGLPGLIIDRFGDKLTLQLNTAGMAAHQDLLLEVLDSLIDVESIVARNDSPSRELEGLESAVEILKGDSEAPDPDWIVEAGLPFAVARRTGQKTGWFFDQRDNRNFVRRIAGGASVLDLYSYGGGFGLAALAGGATKALSVDRAQAALDLAKLSAERQGVQDRFAVHQSEAFAFLDKTAEGKERFDLVVSDPPAFVRNRKMLGAGLKGYRKLAKGSATITAPGGILCVGCCSHNVPIDRFTTEVWAGIRQAGRGGRIIYSGGAGPDHPIHPSLPETAYLKFLAFALD